MMGYDRICSSAITAPVTALAFDGSNTLYAGSGGQITAYSNIGVEDESIGVITIGSIDVFSTDTVHGLKCVEGSREVVAFGGKAVCITSFERRDGNDSVSDFNSSLVMKMLFDGLDDLALDSIMIKDILFIGFAHNFIDVLVILPGYSDYIKLYRIQCPDISALFSLSIAAQTRFETSGRNMKLLVASGTVFGKIILWNFDITAAGLHDDNYSKKDSHAINDVVKIPDVTIDNVLKTHEGVIFKLQWSKDRQKIASVSDDRTVRVWMLREKKKAQQIFVGWGHLNRLWDVIFLGEKETMIATSSEDGTLKIWDFKTEGCIATLRGHSSDIWCITKATFPTVQQDIHDKLSDVSKNHNCSDGLVIFSGGNDGSIKGWPLAAHCKASSSDPSSHLTALALPTPPPNSIIISSSGSDSGSDIKITGNNSSNTDSSDPPACSTYIPPMINLDALLLATPPLLPIIKSPTTKMKISSTATPGEATIAGSKAKKVKITSTASSKKAARPPRPPSSRGSNGISVLRLTSDGQRAIVLMCEGEIWMVDLELAVLTSNPIGADSKQGPVKVTSTTRSPIKTERGPVSDNHTEVTSMNNIKSSSTTVADIPNEHHSSKGIDMGSTIDEERSTINEEISHDSSSMKFPTDVGWTYIGTLDKGVTNADIAFYTHLEWTHMTHQEAKQNSKHTESDREEKLSDDIYCRITCAHKDGFVSLVDVTISHGKRTEEYNESLENIIRIPKVDCRLSIFPWKANEFRTINVWQLKTVPRVDDIYFNGYVLSSSLKGSCKLWARRRGRGGGTDLEGRDNSGGASNGEGGNAHINEKIRDAYELLFECVTGKEQIATCSALLDRNCLLIGDCRGGISIYKWNDLDLHNSTNSQKSSLHDLHKNPQESKIERSVTLMKLNLYIPHIHGDDLVSCIKPCSRIEADSFCSVGHDGMFCVFNFNGGLISRMNCLPIKTPNEITLIGKGCNASIYIGGYLGDLYLVWDIRRGYQVIRIEAGGWRRPHHAILSFPINSSKVTNDRHTSIDNGSIGAGYFESNALPSVLFACSPSSSDSIKSLLICDTATSNAMFLSNYRPTLLLNSSPSSPIHSSAIAPPTIPASSSSCSSSFSNYLSSIFTSSSSVNSSTQPSTETSSGASSQSTHTQIPHRIPLRLRNIPLHLGVQAHSKVTYCTRILPYIQHRLNTGGKKNCKLSNLACSRYLVVGGEDGSIKILKNTNFTVENSIGIQSSQKTEVILIQEVFMPASLPIKDVAVASAIPNNSMDHRDAKDIDNDYDVDSEILGNRGRGLVVAVGNRLSYSIWEYNLPERGCDECIDHQNNYNTEVKGNVGSSSDRNNSTSMGSKTLPLGYALSFLINGSIYPEATQDHRILCVNCMSFPTQSISKRSSIKPIMITPTTKVNPTTKIKDSHSNINILVDDNHGSIRENPKSSSSDYLIVMGDSRGIATVINYSPPSSSDIDDKEINKSDLENKVNIIDEFSVSPSSCPVLTCDVLTLKKRINMSTKNGFESKAEENNSDIEAMMNIGFFGDTSGMISVWLLAGSIFRSHSTIEVLKNSESLTSYRAHAMGANSLSVQLIPSCTATQNIEKNTASWDVFIASGGDDQAITYCQATITLKYPQDNLCAIEISTAYQRADGCSGSAIKGVKLFIYNTSSSISPIPIPLHTTESSDIDKLKIPNVNDLIMDLELNSMNKMSNLLILSVGYDQRLSFWKPKVSTSLRKENRTVTIQHDCASKKPDEVIDKNNIKNIVSKKILDNVTCVEQNCDNESDVIHNTYLDTVNDKNLAFNNNFGGGNDDDSLLDGHDESILDDDNESFNGFNEVSVPMDDLLKNRDDILEWVGGIPVHVGDVCALDAIVASSGHNYGQGQIRSVNGGSIETSGDTGNADYGKNVLMSRIDVDIVVAGEGFQIFNAVI